MSTFIKIAGVTPPSSRPRVDTLDPLLPVRGALVLIDPTHPASPWAPGTPGANTQVPNIAASQLAEIRGAMLGGDSLSARYVKGSAWDDKVHGVVTRTARGGIHGKPSQTAAYQAGAFRSIELPQAALAHVVANQEHSYYFSQWSYISKPEGAGYPVQGFIGHNHSAAGPRVISWQSSSQPTTGAPEYLGHWNDSPATTGDKFRYLAVSKVSGTGALTLSDTLGRFGWGRLSPSLTNPEVTQGFPSYVIYRQYFEDLTISGRTHAEVAAIDRDLHIREVLTAGGRYFGDVV